MGRWDGLGPREGRRDETRLLRRFWLQFLPVICSFAP